MTTRLAFILWAVFMSFSAVFGQQKFPKSAFCRDQAFDKKVDSYLDYSVPVMDVTTAGLKKSDFMFLDAREQEEFNISHIGGARHVGYDDFSLSKLSAIPKDQKIIVYCSIGYRSEKIAKKLRDAGYANVFNLYGSLFEWANRGFDLLDIQGKKTRKIHTYNSDWSRWVTRSNLEKVW
jgi:rhodanese-related sulfurtransferase